MANTLEKNIGRGGVELSRPLWPNIFHEFPPMGVFVLQHQKKKNARGPPLGVMLGGNGLLWCPLSRGAQP